MENYRPPANRSVEGLTFFVTTRLAVAEPIFGDPRNAQVALDCLQFFRKRGEMDLYSYVIMPDHIHIILKPISPATLPKIMRRFKSFVAKQLGRGPIWGEGYWSEVIPHRKSILEKTGYIHKNASRAGIAVNDAEYVWSSAWACMQKKPEDYIDIF